MRIMTISNAYPPHYYGGYELTCADVMHRFAVAGHDVLVLTSTERVPNAGPEDAAVAVRRELSVAWNWQAGAPQRPRSPVRRWRDARHDLDALTEALRAHRPDVASIWHFGALPLPLLVALEDARVPMVVTVANDWLTHAEALDPWTRLWRFLPVRVRPRVAGVPTRLPRLDGAAFNFVSAHTRSRAASATAYDVAAAPVIHPGIDIADFPVRAATARQWRWRLLYVGRVTPDKGVATLIRSMARLPSEATLDVLGDAEPAYAESLRQLARDCGVVNRVQFGRCARSDLAERYAAADVVVFPSEWDEPFGLVPLEAMACATPVVATATGGSAEFLRDGDNCLVFPPGDSAALARSVLRLADDAPLRARLTAAGHSTASRLTADAYADALLALHVAATNSVTAPVGSPRPEEDPG